MTSTYTTLLSDYQPRALDTALPTAFSYEYCVNAVFGEVGELFNKRAKAERDGWSDSRLKEALLPEYGDIAWPTAVLLKWQGVTTIREHTVNVVDATSNDDAWSDLAYWANDLVQEYRALLPGSRGAVNSAERLWVTLADSCQAVTGQPFSAALAYNVAKLADRQQRGVIAGSGDFR